jgi:hypothetical protein
MSETIQHGGRHGHGDERQTPDAEHIENPDVLHETSDVDVRAIIKSILVLAIGTALVFGIIYGVMKAFSYAANKIDPQAPSPLALKGDARLPPEPRLQGAPGWQADGRNLELREPQAERKVIFERWNNELEKGSVDLHTGASALPIEEAKRRLLEENLPARQAPAAQANASKIINEGIAVPGFQSSGQQTESRDK